MQSCSCSFVEWQWCAPNTSSNIDFLATFLYKYTQILGSILIWAWANTVPCGTVAGILHESSSSQYKSLTAAPNVLQEMIDEADQDGDGEVSEQEFLRIMKKTSLYWSPVAFIPWPLCASFYCVLISLEAAENTGQFCRKFFVWNDFVQKF